MSNSPSISEKSLASTFPIGFTWDGMAIGVMRELSDGLSIQIERDRQEGIKIKTDFFPYTTEFLEEWEFTFGLPIGKDLTDEQRVSRLVASWQKLPPGTYTGTNFLYALSGLDIIARPLLPTEDPRIIAEEVDSQIFANGRQGIVSKNYITVCGLSRCGNISNSSRCGNFEGSKILPPIIGIPDDNWTWPLIYILEDKAGGPAFILENQLDSFLFLTYKIKPLFMWAIAKYQVYNDIFNLVNDDGDQLVNDDDDFLIELD